MAVRRAETDADLEAWIRVRRAVIPNESGGTVKLLRVQASPDRLLLLGEVGGDVVGTGTAARSMVGDRIAVQARVLPAARRRGVGTALLRELAAHAARRGVQEVSTTVEDGGSRAFAERFGFAEVGREVEQVKRLDTPPGPPARLPGVELVTVEQRPELLRAAFPLARDEGYADLAIESPARGSARRRRCPAARSIALADGEIVGYSGLVEHDDDGVAEDGLTVVRRDRRRLGLGGALKRAELAWAAANGIREVVTWTQRGNGAMRRLNELLGYEYRGVAVRMVAPLPLRAASLATPR